MPIPFKLLENAYDKYNKMDTKGLYETLGWSDLIGRPEWGNTCAIRMSLALLEAGVHVGGRLIIKRGSLRGKFVEPGQNRLAQQIERRILGAPQKYSNEEFFKSGHRDLWTKTGIASFMRIPSYAGGHIDLIDVRNDWYCRRSCYFNANEIWFWRLR